MDNEGGLSAPKLLRQTGGDKLSFDSIRQGYAFSYIIDWILGHILLDYLGVSLERTSMYLASRMSAISC